MKIFCRSIVASLFAVTLLGMVSQTALAQVTDANNETFENADTKDREAKSQQSPSDRTVKSGGYEFTIENEVSCSPVRSQDRTGTCWCYAGTSFLESELMRRSEGTHDLSEMFVVKNIYRDKALNYVLRHGKANFSQGALAHDYINAIEKYGIVPEETFTGKTVGETAHNHDEMESILKSMLEAVVKQKKLSPRWSTAFDKVLSVYLGDSPEVFQYRNASWTPQDFADSIEFNAKDYVAFTSYSHHPFYEPFVLEIPDNFSNGSFMNVPVDDMVEIIDTAIDAGYSVMWDGDVSEKGFSANRGVAVLPADGAGKGLNGPVEQMNVTQELRQERLLSYSTTDDHLMHLVGRATDQMGNKYYVIKNSWGKIGPHKGYLYMSEAYVRLHTLAITLNRDCLDSRYDR
ncbi:C1 family peptidase [Mariniblastus fucicola]|uniref:Aminopeptidase n=1 Tax=Mariniblastus fucicola TaxID=980251 RepID=A0A5B9PCE2_9BACT|nr:C1 family peptidase [Mariniblastus fucicola]QEG22592.1 Aminopeptidase C [Mariniblastus fucicola]